MGILWDKNRELIIQTALLPSNESKLTDFRQQLSTVLTIYQSQCKGQELEGADQPDDLNIYRYLDSQGIYRVNNNETNYIYFKLPELKNYGADYQVVLLWQFHGKNLIKSYLVGRGINYCSKLLYTLAVKKLYVTQANFVTLIEETLKVLNELVEETHEIFDSEIPKAQKKFSLNLLSQQALLNQMLENEYGSGVQVDCGSELEIQFPHHAIKFCLPKSVLGEPELLADLIKKNELIQFLNSWLEFQDKYKIEIH